MLRRMKCRPFGATNIAVIVVGVTFALYASSARSQNFTSEWGIAVVEAPTKTVNLDALPPASEVRAPEGPRPRSKSLRGDYIALKEEAAGPAKINPDIVPLAAPARAPNPASRVESPFLSFEGNQKAQCGGSVRPDMALAVGGGATNYYPVMQINNKCISLFTDMGGRRTDYPKSLSSLFDANAFDPRALYDWVNKRYVIVSAAYNGRYWIAVSTENKPEGNYYVYNLDMPSGAQDGVFPDFPRLGQDQDTIYVASNKDGSKGFQYEEWLLLPKQQLYSGEAFSYRFVFNTAVDGVKTDTSQPAVVSFSTDRPPVGFFVSSKTRKVGSGYRCTEKEPPCNGLFVWAVAPNPGSLHPYPLVSGVTVPTKNNYTMPPMVQQRDGMLETGDTSISGQVSYASPKDGPSLFASLTTKNNGGGASALLFRLKPQLGTSSRIDCRGCPIIKSATIADEVMIEHVGRNSTFYATMLPDPEGNTLTVYNLSGPDYYPSAAYILRSAAGQFVGSGQIVREGLRYGDRYNWGDYTAVAPVPPFQDGGRQTMWFAAEFSGDGGMGSLWRTVIGKALFQGTTQP